MRAMSRIQLLIGSLLLGALSLYGAKLVWDATTEARSRDLAYIRAANPPKAPVNPVVDVCWEWANTANDYVRANDSRAETDRRLQRLHERRNPNPQLET